MIRTCFFAAMAAIALPLFAAAQETPGLENAPADTEAESQTDDTETRTFRLRHAGGHDAVARTMEALYMPEGARIVSVSGPPSGGEHGEHWVTVAGPKEALDVIESMVEEVEHKAEPAEEADAQRLEVVRLGRADGGLVRRVLQTFMKGDSNFRVDLDASQNRLLLYGTEDELRKAREVVDAIADDSAEPAEGPERAVKVFEVQHGDARELAELVKTVLPAPTLAIGVDRRINTIVASGAPDDLQRIHQLLLTLDQPSTDASQRAAETDDPSPSAEESVTQYALRRDALARLQSEHEAADQEARFHASDYLRWKEAGDVPDQVLERQRQRIEAAVEKAFETRQQLQSMEVERLRERLNTIERRVQRREALKDRIIERRLAELLEAEAAPPPEFSGPVEIEQIEPQDFLILRGGAADVRRVVETIQSLEGRLVEQK